MADLKVPVYMRVGDSEEHEVGTVSLAVTSETSREDGVLTATVTREPVAPKVAGLLREVADEMDRQALAVSGG